MSHQRLRERHLPGGGGAGWVLLAVPILVAANAGVRPPAATVAQAAAGAGWTTSRASAYSAADSPGRMACTRRRVPWTGALVAHKSLPCGTRIRVCHRARCVTARVADRGPYIPGRDLDLTPGTYRALGATTARGWGVRTVTWRRQ